MFFKLSYEHIGAVNILGMLLLLPQPVFPVTDKDIHSVGELSPVGRELRAPYAVYVFRLVDIDLSVLPKELKGSIDIKNQHSAGRYK